MSGGHYYWYEVDPRRTTATAKVSHLADNFLGASHDFKFGVQYSDAVARGIYGYNDLVYTYSLRRLPRYGYGYNRQPFSYSGNSRNVGVFFDDTVRLNDRLSVNFGLRYDHNKAYSAEQNELDEFGQPTGAHVPEDRLLHLELLLAPRGLQLEAHEGRAHGAEGPLGPLPPLDRHRRVRQRDRAQHQADLLGDLLVPRHWDPSSRRRRELRRGPRALRGQHATSASTPTTRAPTPTSTS